MVEVTGIGGFIILVLDVWAIVSIIGSRATTGAKVLWTLFVVLLPVLGFLVWFFLGPRAEKQLG